MSQIKKIEKAYNQKILPRSQRAKGIKLRDEVNKINGAKKTSRFKDFGCLSS